MVPASDFYEWKKWDEQNRHSFDLANGQLMAFAGPRDAWKDPANGQNVSVPYVPMMIWLTTENPDTKRAIVYAVRTEGLNRDVPQK